MVKLLVDNMEIQAEEGSALLQACLRCWGFLCQYYLWMHSKVCYLYIGLQHLLDRPAWRHLHFLIIWVIYFHIPQFYDSLAGKMFRAQRTHLSLFFNHLIYFIIILAVIIEIFFVNLFFFCYYIRPWQKIIVIVHRRPIRSFAGSLTCTRSVCFT